MKNIKLSQTETLRMTPFCGHLGNITVKEIMETEKILGNFNKKLEAGLSIDWNVLYQ